MKSLIFVYNADSGIFNAILDSAHKLFNPSTYSCDLCALTFHTFGEKRKWKNFRKNLNMETKFLHKDEFQIKFPKATFQLPVVLKYDGELKELISAEEFKTLKTLDDLITEVQKRLTP